jgi:hypothetical protein
MKRTLNITAVTGLILALAAGCAEKKDLNSPNLPPETYIAVGDSVRNPTVYMQTVNWWGDDSDGEVIGYEYRWAVDPGEPCCPLNTSWVFTEATSMEFNLPVTDGLRSHTIFVRAIDDQEEPDPDPAQATFPVTNSPPTIMIWDQADLPDTTLPAILLKWHADDPEGRETIQAFKVWLDGPEADPILLAAEDTTVSLGPDDFKGVYGERTISIVAIDTGCDTSNVVSHTWYVAQPSGDILLVDDLSKQDYASAYISDRFYRGALDGCGAGYSVLDIAAFGGVGYTYNLKEIFGLFDLVIWYNDPLRPGTPGLAAADEAFRSYVAGGGRLILISLGAVGNSGALADSAAFETFGVDTLYIRNGQSNFDCTRWDISANGGLGLDDLKVTGLYPGVECLKLKPEATPLYHIPPGTTSAAQTKDYYLGVMNSWQGGKAIFITFPMSRADSFGNAATEFCKLIDLVLD